MPRSPPLESVPLAAPASQVSEPSLTPLPQIARRTLRTQRRQHRLDTRIEPALLLVGTDAGRDRHGRDHHSRNPHPRDRVGEAGLHVHSGQHHRGRQHHQCGEDPRHLPTRQHSQWGDRRRRRTCRRASNSSRHLMPPEPGHGDRGPLRHIGPANPSSRTRGSGSGSFERPGNPPRSMWREVLRA